MVTNANLNLSPINLKQEASASVCSGLIFESRRSRLIPTEIWIYIETSGCLGCPVLQKNPCLGGIPRSREGGNLILDSMIDKKPEGLDYLEMKPNEI